MKKFYYYILFLLLPMLAFVGCHDEVVYDEDNDHHNMMVCPMSYSNNRIISLAQSKYPNEAVTVFLCEGGSGPSTCFTLNVDLLDSDVGLC